MSTQLSPDDLSLLQSNLLIDDPETIPGLVQGLPDASQAVGIEAKYDITGSGKPKVRCAWCGRAVHWKGFVVDLGGSAYALVGRTCGRAAFGIDWNSYERQFDAKRRRQADLQRLLSVQAALPAALEELRSSELAQAADQYHAFLDGLRRVHGRFGQALAKSARAGGDLLVTEEERDPQAEERNIERQRPDLVKAVENALTDEGRVRASRRLKSWIDKEGRVYKSVVKRIGRCDGYAVLGGRDPKTELRTGSDRVGAQARKLLDPAEPWAEAEALSAAFKAMREALSEIEGAASLLGELERFLAPSNWNVIAGWAARFDASLDEDDDSNFVDDFRQISPPRDYATPSLIAVSELREAVGRG